MSDEVYTEIGPLGLSLGALGVAWAIISLDTAHRKHAVKKITKLYTRSHPDVIPYHELRTVNLSISEIKKYNLDWKYPKDWNELKDSVILYGHYHRNRLRYVSAFYRYLDEGEAPTDSHIYRKGHDHAFIDPKFEKHREYYEAVSTVAYGMTDDNIKAFIKSLKYGSSTNLYKEEYNERRNLMSRKLTYRDLLETDGEVPEQIVESWGNPFEKEKSLMESADSVEEYEFYRKKLDRKVNEMLAYYEDQLDDIEHQNDFGILEDGTADELTDPLYEKIGEIKSMAYPWYEEMTEKPELFSESVIDVSILIADLAIIGKVIAGVALFTGAMWGIFKLLGSHKQKYMRKITEAYSVLHPDVVPYQALKVMQINRGKVRSLNLKWDYLDKWESEALELVYYGYFYNGKLMYASAFVKIYESTDIHSSVDGNYIQSSSIYRYGHDHAYVNPKFERYRDYYDNMACFDYGITDMSMREFLKNLQYEIKHNYNEECEAIRGYIENDMITEDTLLHIYDAAEYNYISEESADHMVDLIHRLEHASFHEEEYLV